MRSLPLAWLPLFCLALAAPGPGRADPAAGPGRISALALHGIDSQLRGDFEAAEAVWKRMQVEDPGDPAPPVLRVSGLYWQQMFDGGDESWDPIIRESAESATRIARARLDGKESDPWLHFYLGQAHFQVARVTGYRGQMLTAARHADKAREQLERALELDPRFVDAKYALGMYNYYLDVLPDFIRWLRFLPFMPKGDKPTGLRYLSEVHERGQLYRWDATFFLMNIYSYHQQGDLHRALALGTELRDRFPENPFFRMELIEVLQEAGRYDEAVEQALILERAGEGETPTPPLSRMARAARARAELYQGRPSLAWDLLGSFGPGEPASPLWGSAWVTLTRGQIFDVLGERKSAVTHYEQVTALKPPRRSDRAARLAKRWLDEPYFVETGPSISASP